MELLQLLNLSHCVLTSLELRDLPSLRVLDLSYNLIGNLSTLTLRGLTGLLWLDLSHNPLVPMLGSEWTAMLRMAGVVKVSYGWRYG
jgi:Leucine-rich repeat (LRR) protein